MESTNTYVMGGMKNSLMIFLASVMVKGGKYYCTPSISAIKDRLEKYQKIFLKRSWLYAGIQDLEARGFIYRKKRIVRMKNGTLRSKLAMISITVKGYNYLISKGFTAAHKLKADLLAYIHGGDKRFPHPATVSGPPDETSQKSTLSHISDIFKGIVHLVM